jgi:hypothetical protein
LTRIEIYARICVDRRNCILALVLALRGMNIMLTLDTIIVALPAVTGGLALLGYAGLMWQRHKAQQSQAKPRPIPVTSRKRHDARRYDNRRHNTQG